MRTKIIDAQSHYMPEPIAENTTFFKVHWSDLDRQLKVMDDHGIEKSLLLYPTSDAHIQMGGWQKVCEVYNKAIADVAQKHPDRLIPAGILPVDSPDQFKKELKRLDDFGFRCLSLASSYEGMYLDEEMFDCVFEFAQKKNWIIHVHPQIINPIGQQRVHDPLLTPVLEYVFDVSMCLGKMLMSGTFLKYKDVKFIFAHYGGVLPIIKERFDSTYTMLRRREFVKDLSDVPSAYFKSLYFDTSGSQSPASLSAALEVTDASHILFASDYPANQNLARSIGMIENGALDQEQKDFILGKNLLGLLDLEKTASVSKS